MKKKIIKIVLLVVAIAIISIGLLFLLRTLGVTDTNSLKALIEGCGIWGPVVFVTLFVAVCTLLCFVPATTATFLIVGTIIFPPIEAFLLCALSVFISSTCMFFVGDKLGEKVVIKLVGKESLEKAQKLIDVKSKIFLPLMLLFPAFPDDALCMVAGLTKMKYWYFAIIVAIFRTIGVATFVFLGSGILPFDDLNVIEWFMLINVVIFDIFIIFKLSDKLEKYIYKRGEKQKELQANNETAVNNVDDMNFSNKTNEENNN